MFLFKFSIQITYLNVLLHTHTHTLSPTHTLSHTHTLSLSLFLSLSFSLSLSPTHTHSLSPPPPQNTHKIKGAFRYKKGWTGRGKSSRSQRILLVSLEGRSQNWPSLGRYVINFMLHRFRDCCYSNTIGYPSPQ